jgi:hypothetical protein
VVGTLPHSHSQWQPFSKACVGDFFQAHPAPSGLVILTSGPGPLFRPRERLGRGDYSFPTCVGRASGVGVSGAQENLTSLTLVDLFWGKKDTEAEGQRAPRDTSSPPTTPKMTPWVVWGLVGVRLSPWWFLLGRGAVSLSASMYYQWGDSGGRF